MSTLTPPIKWHGGKHYLAKRIIELMPPHTHYVEPYFGGGAVLLAKDPEGVSEVVNDLSGELTNFWKVLSSPTQFPKFSRYADSTPFCEQIWKTSGEPFVSFGDHPEGNWNAALRFFIRARQSRQGLMKDFATLSRNRTRRGMNEQVSSWLTAIEGLPDVHARLKRVVILNRDALGVIKSQDGSKTLFYLDYAHKMNMTDHVELLQALRSIDGKFMLSGYRSELYDDWSSACGWHRVDFDLPNNASSTKVKERKIECVWCNFDPNGRSWSNE